MLRLPKGISDFREIIINDYTIIDKSLLIKEVIDDPARVILIPRPRRFGKTTNMSMLDYFFKRDEKRENMHLFDNLAISRAGEKYLKEKGIHPTIFITLKQATELKFEDTLETLKLLMQACYTKHAYLLNSPHLEPNQKKIFDAILSNKASRAELKNSLVILTRLLKAHYKQNVILIVDEYDAPLHASLANGYLTEMTTFMRGFLGEALKDNKAIKKAVITGILQVGQASLFSGLNNVHVCNLFTESYSSCFGFTQEEVDSLFEQAELPHTKDEIKDWYNGYRIGTTSAIYNPWSIICCILNKGKTDMYWVETGEYNLVGSALKANNNFDMQLDFEALAKGDRIFKTIDPHVVLNDISKNKSALWTTLLYAGYLQPYEAESVELGSAINCYLAAPNREIRGVFMRWASVWFGEAMGSIDDYRDFVNALVIGNIPRFSDGLETFLLSSLSYFDLGKKPKENIYHIFFLGMLAGLNYYYTIESNQESGKGRFDLMMIPRRKEKQHGVIFELKAVDSPQDLEKAAKAALEQIQNKDYLAKLRTLEVPKILTIGMSFCGKEASLAFKEL